MPIVSLLTCNKNTREDTQSNCFTIIRSEFHFDKHIRFIAFVLYITLSVGFLLCEETIRVNIVIACLFCAIVVVKIEREKRNQCHNDEKIRKEENVCGRKVKECVNMWL